MTITPSNIHLLKNTLFDIYVLISEVFFLSLQPNQNYKSIKIVKV